MTMKESNGETRKVDTLSDLIRMQTPCLSEHELHAQMTAYLIRLSKELTWIGADDKTFAAATRAVIEFADFLREEFYGGRH